MNTPLQPISLLVTLSFPYILLRYHVFSFPLKVKIKMRAVARGYDEHPKKGRGAAVKERETLVKLHVFEITVEDCGAYYGRESEQNKLYWDDDFAVETL